ncbi:MAG: hypothetical protein HY746_00705 [Elusimicrobia bacterium]|nr:hypothetical protein [Elusimicrobiota bacterium]
MQSRKIIIIGLKTLIIAAALVIATFYLLNLYGPFQENRDRINKLKPMIAEAKELNISFEQVMSESGKFTEKHVIWCIQNIAEDQVFCRGDLKKRLSVSNHWDMQVHAGGKHSVCTDMLLKIKSAKTTSTKTSVVNVEFISAME